MEKILLCQCWKLLLHLSPASKAHSGNQIQRWRDCGREPGTRDSCYHMDTECPPFLRQSNPSGSFTLCKDAIKWYLEQMFSLLSVCASLWQGMQAPVLTACGRLTLAGQREKIRTEGLWVETRREKMLRLIWETYLICYQSNQSGITRNKTKPSNIFTTPLPPFWAQLITVANDVGQDSHSTLVVLHAGLPDTAALPSWTPEVLASCQRQATSFRIFFTSEYQPISLTADSYSQEFDFADLK